MDAQEGWAVDFEGGWDEEQTFFRKDNSGQARGCTLHANNVWDSFSSRFHPSGPKMTSLQLHSNDISERKGGKNGRLVVRSLQEIDLRKKIK